MSVQLPDLPSWLWVVVIGILIVLLLHPIGWMIMFGGFVLGIIYFALDIRKKI